MLSTQKKLIPKNISKLLKNEPQDRSIARGLARNYFKMFETRTPGSQHGEGAGSNNGSKLLKKGTPGSQHIDGIGSKLFQNY